jgi:hypothetical protein
VTKHIKSGVHQEWQKYVIGSWSRLYCAAGFLILVLRNHLSLSEAESNGLFLLDDLSFCSKG